MHSTDPPAPNALAAYGWTPDLDEAWRAIAHELDAGLGDVVPARVTSEYPGLFRVTDGDASYLAEASGRLKFTATGRGDLPAVGDFVAVDRPRGGHDRLRIHAILPRRTKISRRSAGEAEVEQVLAANVDAVLIAVPVDAQFNLRRLERFLTVAWDSGAEPLVVLTKCDLVPELGRVVSRVMASAPGVLVIPTSAKLGVGLDELSRQLGPGRTAVLIGTSGAGKSSLMNAIAGSELAEVQEVRAIADKGRHTTTRRELIRLGSGAIIIDTPGLREMQLWDGAGGASETFPDIVSLAEACRFNDCAHSGEPGCAVRSAVEEGRLADERYRSYLKLRREEAVAAREADARARAEERSRLKARSKAVRRLYRERERDMD